LYAQPAQLGIILNKGFLTTKNESPAHRRGRPSDREKLNLRQSMRSKRLETERPGDKAQTRRPYLRH
jgi:hypothetical protein